MWRSAGGAVRAPPLRVSPARTSPRSCAATPRAGRQVPADPRRVGKPSAGDRPPSRAARRRGLWQRWEALAKATATRSSGRAPRSGQRSASRPEAFSTARLAVPRKSADSFPDLPQRQPGRRGLPSASRLAKSAAAPPRAARPHGNPGSDRRARDGLCVSKKSAPTSSPMLAAAANHPIIVARQPHRFISLRLLKEGIVYADKRQSAVRSQSRANCLPR